MRRLRRDARTLEIGQVDEAEVVRAFDEIARAVFGAGDGVVRLQASRDGEGRLHLVGIPRQLGEEPETWRAIIAPFAHEGQTPWPGVKVSNHLLSALAGASARAAGVDEALLVDRDGHIVEGSRSNLCVASGNTLATPDLARGGVAGIAREIACERLPDLVVRDIDLEEVRAADELIALNSVRGARPIVSLDGRPIASGKPGLWSQRLADVFAH